MATHHKNMAYTNPTPSTGATEPPRTSSQQAEMAAQEKYHALIIDSGAIIKQTAFTQLHTSATNFYTVPAVLSEIRDAVSRKHLEDFQLRLQSLNDKQIETRTPSQEAVRVMSEFARKTGDYAQLSGVDLQVLALLYDLEVEAANLYNNGNIGHVRREPKRVLGVSVKALNGDGKLKRRDRGDSVATSSSVATSNNATSIGEGVISSASFFQGDADGIIDASNVDLEYDDDDDQTRNDDVSVANTVNTQPSKPKTWATLVNPTEASSTPLLNYSLADVVKKTAEKEATVELDELGAVNEDDVSEGQFDDASEDEDAFSENEESDGELKAINIANAESDEEMSDEECDVFILEPHEAVYYKKLKEKKLMKEKEEVVNQFEQQALNDDGGLGCDFPSLSAAAAVPYEGSDDEMDGTPAPVDEEKTVSDLEWQQEEEERKKKALQPMVNGRFQAKKAYNSFRKYKNVVSAGGSSNAVKKVETVKEEENPAKDETSTPAITHTDDSQAYKSRIIGASGASSANDFPSEMTADDDDGEGWVTCTRDIQNIKATGSLQLNSSRNGKSLQPKKDNCPPISQRAACATTDFAMQNVILQMNLELLSVDGVRVRRLKTWVTRCGACFTIYGGNDQKGKQGNRLFCDKCGSNVLQRISASVDRNSGRLKLHMKKNYQYNTRGTKFALPKAGKGNKYEGDLLLAEDQLMYGAWGQKVRKGKSKASGQSIFGSDLASDLGCHYDLTKRDDIKVGFGRRNPNSSKFGRERRGKKKKNTTDKACGLRRY
jgi:RNA-binding protein NOB1